MEYSDPDPSPVTPVRGEISPVASPNISGVVALSPSAARLDQVVCEDSNSLGALGNVKDLVSILEENSCR